jgi:predicted transcriptional regulator
VSECAEFGRAGITVRRLVQLLSSAPATTVLGASAALDISVPSIGAAIERLELAGLVREITGRSRDRVFVYTPAVALAE